MRHVGMYLVYQLCFSLLLRINDSYVGLHSYSKHRFRSFSKFLSSSHSLSYIAHQVFISVVFNVIPKLVLPRFNIAIICVHISVSTSNLYSPRPLSFSCLLLRQGLNLALTYISIAAKSFTTNTARLEVLGLVESPGCWELM